MVEKEFLQFEDMGFQLSDPIQEDYGWGIWASHDEGRFWVALSYVGDGPQEPPAHWIISVSYDAGLNFAKRLFHKPDRQALGQLQDRVRKILASNAAIRII